jgi:hypothetical protein
MLAQPIESFISGMGASVMTDGFIVIIAITFIAAIVAKRSDRAHGFTQYVPTLLTSLGILGTFCGIVAGLLGFDANNIDGSIGSLLEGMKTAFTTSLVGMSSSIIYKVLASSGMLTPKGDNIIDEDQIGILELYTVMKDQADGMTLLQQAIGGDNDSSLTSQMKLMRSDNNDQNKLALQSNSDNHKELLVAVALQQTAFESFQDKLWIKLQDFADMLSKSATETVIEALKQVIADFNKNLTEQFGENFKQLNEACKELVTWQDQYKDQLDDMGEKYRLGVESIGVTATAVGSITEHTAQIPAHMENLKDITEVNQHQIKELERHLEAFKDIRDKAVEAVPEIRAQIDSTLEGVKTASVELAKGIKESSESMGNAITGSANNLVDTTTRVHESLQSTSSQIDAYNEKAITHHADLAEGMNASYRDLSVRMQDEAKKITDEYGKAGTQLVEELDRSKEVFNTGLDTMRTQLNSTLESMASRQSDEANKIFNGLTTQIENSLSSTGDAVDKQVGMIDKALEHEIEKVMTEMGSALASISRQFTNDYTQLVNAMQNIVETHNV